MNSTYVRARIEPELKEDATEVFGKMGLTVSDGIRLFLMKVVSDKALPFEVKIPNATTAAAMRAVDDGEVEYIEDLDDLL